MCSGATSAGKTFSPLASGTRVPLPPAATLAGITRLSRLNDTAVPVKDAAVGVVDGSALTVGEATAVGLACVGAGTTVRVGAAVGTCGTSVPHAARKNPATRAAISK